eukprot:CAMPEP_0115890540 /NCGR_PEP_ID=MMETSP0287-20121206/33404_1 /TAXON_ID=412157 /ORGANISM="Chrysochromulina rotalis, Strain UIO044" /LENGTH=267 /DNA_ID=CAMNT_0003347315 /DNA_START=11 /DNA_END=815 /DNA_ORIENTATION=-
MCQEHMGTIHLAPTPPGLGGDPETTSLLTRSSLASTSEEPHGRPSPAFAARHANSKLQLSTVPAAALSSAPESAAVDQLLAADGSWRLVAAGENACSRLAPPGDDGAGQRSRLRAGVASPTAHARLHVTIGGRPVSVPLTIELYGKVVPKTVENFVRLCRGSNGANYQYAGSSIQRVIPGFMAQGGSTFVLPHEARGVLSMANAGEDTNGSQFFILFNPQPHLNGKHVVFGRIVKGLEGIDEIEAVGSRGGQTSAEVRIAMCEVLGG